MVRIVTVTSADVDLFHVAAKEMFDASQWHLIARANGLTDPRITGMMTLTIPLADPTQTGGVPPQDFPPASPAKPFPAPPSQT